MSSPASWPQEGTDHPHDLGHEDEPEAGKVVVIGDDRKYLTALVCPNFEALRRNDVGQLAVFILDQRDEGRAVRIVFEALDDARDTVLVPLEVDDPVMLLVAATAMTGGDPAQVVAPAALGQGLQEASLGLGGGDLGKVTEAGEPPAGRGRF